MTALSDRRQAAREAYYASIAKMTGYYQERTGMEAAIETATRVRITHEIVMAFMQAPDDPDDIAGPLAAAFRAAGFEVEDDPSETVHNGDYGVPLDRSSNVQYHTEYDSSGLRESLDQAGSETRTGTAGARPVEGVGPAGDAQRSAGASDDHYLRGRNHGHAASGGGSAGAGIWATGSAAPEPVGAGNDGFGTVTPHYGAVGAPEVHIPHCPARYEPAEPCIPGCGLQHKPDSGAPITDHVYRGGNQIGDLCNHVYPIEGDGWPGMRCATPEHWHHDRHPQQAPRKDTLPS